MRANHRKGPSPKKKKPAKKKPETKGSARKKRVKKALAGLKDGTLNTPEDTLGQEHAAAVAAGENTRIRSQSGQPGRAQAIIKNRRV